MILICMLNQMIQKQDARLIPVLKTGDELALTSIFLSTVRLVMSTRKIFLKK